MRFPAYFLPEAGSLSDLPTEMYRPFRSLLLSCYCFLSPITPCDRFVLFFLPVVCIYFCNVLNGQSVSFIIIAFCLYVKKNPESFDPEFFVSVTFLLSDRFLISVCFYEHSCIFLSASQVEHLDQEDPAHSIVCYHGYKIVHRSDQRT